MNILEKIIGRNDNLQVVKLDTNNTLVAINVKGQTRYILPTGTGFFVVVDNSGETPEILDVTSCDCKLDIVYTILAKEKVDINVCDGMMHEVCQEITKIKTISFMEYEDYDADMPIEFSIERGSTLHVLTDKTLDAEVQAAIRERARKVNIKPAFNVRVSAS